METKTITAWDAAADWWWVGHYALRVPRGKVLYCEAFTNGSSKNIRLSPLNTGGYVRYIKPDRQLELVPVERE